MPGLRERKKQETRKRISDTATGLFMQRGFDKVTVAEIAELANVSKMTVFNYFARKEDMLFDREPEALELIRRAVVERPAGASPLDAMHALLRRLLRDGYPLIAISPGVRQFWRTVEASPTLRARGREFLDRAEAQLARLLADAAGLPAGDPGATLAAAMIWAVQRIAYQVGMTSLDAGDPTDTIRRRQRDAIDRGFAQVTGGLAASPFGRAPRKKPG
ncbi:MAG TPA: TetR/AcrR family transcriptional regulator [Kofleriaceae bacterium]